MKSRIAIIGSGNMAQEYFRALLANKRVELVGIYARNQDAAASLIAGRQEIYNATSIQDLYKETNADGVIVAVSELATEEVLRHVFLYPWTSIVEKPVGIDMPAAINIVTNAARFQRVSYAALNRRFYSSTLNLLSNLSNSSGKRLIKINDQENLILARYNNQPQQVIENWMHANSIHLIDFFNLLGRGDILDVRSTKRTLGRDSFLVESHLEYSSGDVGIYSCYWNTPSSWSINVNVESFEFELKPIEIFRSRSLDNMSWVECPKSESDNSFKPGIYKLCDEFINSLQGLESSLLTIESALETRTIIQRIYDGIKL